MRSIPSVCSALLLILLLHVSSEILSQTTNSWKPGTDWGHWRLGHRTDPDFLTKNRLTVTFGSGAPNFEEVSRQEFDSAMEKAKSANRRFHDQGYIVLRYMTSSISGDSLS